MYFAISQLLLIFRGWLKLICTCQHAELRARFVGDSRHSSSRCTRLCDLVSAHNTERKPATSPTAEHFTIDIGAHVLRGQLRCLPEAVRRLVQEDGTDREGHDCGSQVGIEVCGAAAFMGLSIGKLVPLQQSVSTSVFV